ncbi:rare lipoprotein A [Chitinophaga costaii]|uniref:Probable endolytic peptidoglycan transglycosylase RlpA n=1 Tax=Chitinophaga costaii TaxID=1335309 RepID=A0A1C4AIL5_9BACT|nr:septal ring lytic transglycosylase RlpA family protein [Chitinophaga costaii]PUZ26873.1 septal ring lytic transglycosylase RlpA family protein [Chitinophaga costaii]SCB94359.1 rare lipoprotein A [Chitinophaga costaii]
MTPIAFRRIHSFFLLLICCCTSFACSPRLQQEGQASFYSEKLEGHHTASGSIYHGNALTAAHPTLPFGTKVKVVNQANGQSVTVHVTDRGPSASTGRIIDLSHKAAKKLGMLTTGVAHVELYYKKKI